MTLSQQEYAETVRLNKEIGHIFHKHGVPLPSDFRKEILGFVKQELAKKEVKTLSWTSQNFPVSLKEHRSQHD